MSLNQNIYLGPLMSGILAFSLSAAPAFGQADPDDFPDGQITIIVPYGAGGGNDTVARALASPLSDVLGVPVIVENRPGAGASVGVMHFVETAQPDGQTWLISSTSAWSTVPLLNDVTYDESDANPLVRITNLIEVLIVHSDIPVNDGNEFMEYVAANADTMTMAYGAVGSQGWSAVEQFSRVLDVDIAAVPVASGSGADQVALVAGGQVEAAVVSLTTALPFIRSGDVRLVAFVEEERHPDYPELSTFLEEGHNIRVGDEVSIYIPIGTPEAIESKIDEAVRIVIETEEFNSTLQNLGLFVNYGDKNVLSSIVAERSAIARELVSTQ